MPEIMSAVLFEKKQRALVAHRRRPPFAGQWMLPATLVGKHEAAEEALRRHAREQFGVALAPDGETFVETVYLDDAGEHYVANIFRAELPAGPLRFNVEGDYDDAKWLGAPELEQVGMPPDLRIPLAQVLTAPESLHQTDWDELGRKVAAGQAAPLAERGASAIPPEPAPDNRTGWDTIAKAYQDERYGDRQPGRLMWAWGLFEDDLQVLGDVHGKRALVLGCGGGQDVVALATMGAVAVGIDFSAKQVDYARKYLMHHPVDNASFVEGDMTDLSRFDDESFDLAVAIYSLGFVDDAAAVLTEAARVLRPGGVLAISVEHPFNHTRADDPPYGIVEPYWADHVDWDWTFENGTNARFRRYVRTSEQWFDLLGGAGLVVERVLEPRSAKLTDNTWGLDPVLGKYAPFALIMKARRP
jgi:SAM-dependent methyltransferase/8-oxo-dGTP pyrophosphatase MutT (NUDIX family)